MRISKSSGFGTHQMTENFAQKFIERTSSYLTQIGRSGDIYAEEHHDILPKLKNLMKRREFWMDRHWRAIYQQLSSNDLIVLFKGYILAEAHHYYWSKGGRWQGSRAYGMSVSPSIFMAAEINERGLGIEIKAWIEEVIRKVETGSTGKLTFNTYTLNLLL
jgi:hypothetical protein